MSLPRRWALAIRSQRVRVRPLTGRNSRSKSRLRPTVPDDRVERDRLQAQRLLADAPERLDDLVEGQDQVDVAGLPRSRRPSRDSTWRRRARE